MTTTVEYNKIKYLSTISLSKKLHKVLTVAVQGTVVLPVTVGLHMRTKLKETSGAALALTVQDPDVDATARGV